MCEAYAPGLDFGRSASNTNEMRRFAGAPKYTFTKLINLAVDGLLSFSSIPVRLMIHFGFFVAATSFCVGMVYLILKLLNIGTWPLGFATLFLIIAFLGGIQLITIGMIGEYVGRIHMEVKQRPLFLVADFIGIEPHSRTSSVDTTSNEMPYCWIAKGQQSHVEAQSAE